MGGNLTTWRKPVQTEKEDNNLSSGSSWGSWIYFTITTYSNDNDCLCVQTPISLFQEDNLSTAFHPWVMRNLRKKKCQEPDIQENYIYRLLGVMCCYCFCSIVLKCSIVFEYLKHFKNMNLLKSMNALVDNYRHVKKSSWIALNININYNTY